jgi:hypothetical protein
MNFRDEDTNVIQEGRAAPDDSVAVNASLGWLNAFDGMTKTNVAPISVAWLPIGLLTARYGQGFVLHVCVVGPLQSPFAQVLV